jgi:hypothetical protein
MRRKEKEKQIDVKPDSTTIHAPSREKKNVETNPMMQLNHDSNH